MRHWLLIVSLLLLLPTEGYGQGMSDSRLEHQRYVVADNGLNDLVNETAQQGEDTDSDGIIASHALPLHKQRYTALVFTPTSAAQIQRVSPPIRAPPLHI